MFRSSLQDQARTARDFAAKYGRRFNKNQATKHMQELIGELESSVIARINELDQTVRDLLQIVSTLTTPIIHPSSYRAGVCLGLNERDQDLDQVGAKCHASDICQHFLLAVSILRGKHPLIPARLAADMKSKSVDTVLTSGFRSEGALGHSRHNRWQDQKSLHLYCYCGGPHNLCNCLQSWEYLGRHGKGVPQLEKPATGGNAKRSK